VHTTAWLAGWQAGWLRSSRSISSQQEFILVYSYQILSHESYLLRLRLDEP